MFNVYVQLLPILKYCKNWIWLNPVSTSYSISGSKPAARPGTRGANRGEKEDFKMAMKRQEIALQFKTYDLFVFPYKRGRKKVIPVISANELLFSLRKRKET